MSELLKLVVFVPEAYAQAIRQALGDAGAGRIGLYSHCSYSSEGVSRYIPLEGAKPTIGKVGELEEVSEVRIECVCERAIAKSVIVAARAVHPYEEVTFDIFTLIPEESL